MIEVVCRNAGQKSQVADLAAPRCLAERSCREQCHRRAQRSMRLIEQRDVVTPFLLARGIVARKPVGSLERKRPSLGTSKAAQRRVLPIRGVHDELGDVVAARRRTPRCLACRHATNRPSQIGAVPGPAIIGSIENLQKLPDFRVHPSHRHLLRLVEMLGYVVEVSLGIDCGHTTRSRSGDSLTIDVVLHVTGREDARHARARPIVRDDVAV